MIAALRDIESMTNASVEVILQPGDWHHFYLPAAQSAFPNAKCYTASERNLRKQPSLRAHALDRHAVSVPGLGDEIALIPWLGYTQDSMPRIMSGETRGSAAILRCL